MFLGDLSPTFRTIAMQPSSRTAFSTITRLISKDLIPQHHRCDNLKFNLIIIKWNLRLFTRYLSCLFHSKLSSTCKCKLSGIIDVIVHGVLHKFLYGGNVFLVKLLWNVRVCMKCIESLNVVWGSKMKELCEKGVLHLKGRYREGPDGSIGSYFGVCSGVYCHWFSRFLQIKPG
jgi:hypothetical protein